MDFVDHVELVEELTELLEAARAGARVGGSLAVDAPDADMEALSEAIEADQGRWAHALAAALAGLGAEPTDAVGDFFEKALAIDDFDNRLAFTSRGQAWVVRKLQGLLPRVEDDGLAALLQAMLDAHVATVGAANEALEARGHPIPPQARL